jgi:hypothetical protein
MEGERRARERVWVLNWLVWLLIERPHGLRVIILEVCEWRSGQKWHSDPLLTIKLVMLGRNWKVIGLLGCGITVVLSRRITHLFVINCMCVAFANHTTLFHQTRIVFCLYFIYLAFSHCFKNEAHCFSQSKIVHCEQTGKVSPGAFQSTGSIVLTKLIMSLVVCYTCIDSPSGLANGV